MPAAPNAVQLHESPQITWGEDPQAVTRWRVNNTSDENTAIAVLLGATPVDGVFNEKRLVRQRAKLEPVGSNWWIADVTYGRKKPREPGDWRMSWDTTGGSEKILQSLSTKHAYGIGGATASTSDYRGAIGDTGDSVQGVDIIVPKFKFSIHYTFDASFLNPAVALIHYALSGRINHNPFHGFAAGEVLFLGATGETGSSDIAELSFHFMASPNTQIATAGITIAKGGWDYVWFSYGHAVANLRLRRQAYAAYVEQVYLEGNFGALGIG